METPDSLSQRRQCELLGECRSGLCYEPAKESELNLGLMRRIDELYTAYQFYGSRRMVVCLNREEYKMNRKRVQRLIDLMGIEAIYPKPRLSKSDNEHEKYPYLLRSLIVNRPDQVWATDITYIRL
ncbi:MAG: IS3 family transposase [Candidatus Eisenbacteria bacterium]|nr:IS3 family transposase [Candidatus Eisenbacteria bacterium]